MTTQQRTRAASSTRFESSETGRWSPRRHRSNRGVFTPRLDLIESVRKQIAAGIYDTPDRLDAAMDRLIEALGTHQRR